MYFWQVFANDDLDFGQNELHTCCISVINSTLDNMQYDYQGEITMFDTCSVKLDTLVDVSLIMTG